MVRKRGRCGRKRSRGRDWAGVVEGAASVKCSVREFGTTCSFLNVGLVSFLYAKQ